jgi:8-oxo-dGTP diphosphatase
LILADPNLDLLQYPQEQPDFNFAIALSLVLIGFDGQQLQILLATSARPPFEKALMLPSRYIHSNAEFMLSARKMFEQLFGYDDPTILEQLQAFGKVYRHPGGRVVNVAHYALVRMEDFQSDRWAHHGMQWSPYDQLPDLAYDHNDIVQYAKERLKRRVKRRPVGFNLLPEEFTLGQLQSLYEAALNKSFDKRNFRKKLFKTTLLIDLEKKSDGSGRGQHKGSQLFAFNRDKYEKMKLTGYDFLF